MVDIRGFNGGLNTDSSPELLPNGDYTSAFNIENTAQGIVNILGNQPIASNIISLIGNDWICGAFFDKRRQRIYYFTNNSFGNHRILSHNVDSGLTRELFIDSILEIGESGAARYVRFIKEGNLNIIEIDGAIITDLSVGGTITFSAAGSNNGTFNITAIEYLANKTRLNVFQEVVPDFGDVLITYPLYANESAVLGWPISQTFNPEYLIKDLKVIHREYEGDLVYFVDPSKKLLKFNYSHLFSKKYGLDFSTYKLDYFLVLKPAPIEVINCSVKDDTTYTSNNIHRKLFQFKYRFVFDDNEKSVWSAISKVPLPEQSGSSQFNSQGGVQNCIDIEYFTGDINVEKVEIAARINIDNVWGDFFLVDSVDKPTLGIGSNIVQTYRFRNDGVYVPIDIQESNLLFDYVPDKVNALELANGNTIVVGGIEDGYDKTLPTNPQTSSAAFNAEVIKSVYDIQSTKSTLAAVVRNDEDTGNFVPGTINLNGSETSESIGIIKFSGVPVAGDNITITLNTEWGTPYASSDLFNYPDVEVFSVTVQSGWGISDIINAFTNYPFGEKWTRVYSGVYLAVIKPSKPFSTGTLSNGLYVGLYSIGQRDDRVWRFRSVSVSISSGSKISNTDSISSYKWFGTYKFGLVYYDKNGKTNGVYTTSSTGSVADPMILKTDNYKRPFGPTALPIINKASLKINHLPPSWAEYYHVVRTRELSCDFSLMVVGSLGRSGTVIEIGIQNVIDTAKVYPLSSEIINYSFVKGDRVRVIQKYGSTLTPLPTKPEGNPNGEFRDFEIINVEDKEVELEPGKKTKRKTITVPIIDEFTLGGHPIDGSRVIIEIYRPSKVISDETLSFYEIGYSYPINTIDGVKYHSSNKINQTPTSSFAEVDLTGDGDYYFKNRAMVVGVNITDTGDIYVMDKNFSEVWLSGVWSQGRPLIVDNDIKKEYYPAMLRFSQSYIYGTNINNTNRFYPNNFEEADASFGDILRLKTRENFIRMFQRHKVGMIPIYRQIIIDNAQSSQVALSERLLNKPNYYSGEYGIDKYGSSLVSTDYGDYFIDTINKCIVRVSLDGLTNVSDTNNLMTWSNGNIFEESYGYGCFNYENRNVIILVGRNTRTDGIITGVQNQIVAYNEPNKKFESYYGYSSAENILFINGLIYTGYQGRLFIHNNPVRNNFFGSQQNSLIGTVFNGNVQLKKTYTAIEELASSLWTANIVTGPLTNQFTDITAEDFKKTVGAYVINSKENKFNATIKRSGFGIDKYFGVPMKGLYAQVSLTNSLTTEQRLISVSLKYITSPLTNS